MSSKPTLILVPGSWHVPEHFEPMTKLLETHGYHVVGARLPSNRQTPPWGQTCLDDAAAVAARILTECDAGNDIVLVMHSYDGVPGSSAAKGLLKKDREAHGLKGGIIGLIYIAALVLDEGTKIWDLLEPFADRTTGAPWSPVIDGQYNFPLDPIGRFYKDVDDDKAKKAVGLLQKQSWNTNFSEQTYSPWKHLPSTYIMTIHDEAIPMQHQEMFASLPGSQFIVEKMESAHSPFISKTEDTAALIEKYAIQFGK